MRGCLMSAEPESSSAQSWLCPRLGWEQKPGARGGSQLWGPCCFSRGWRLQEAADPGSRGELHLLKAGAPADTPPRRSLSDSLHSVPSLMGVAVALRVGAKLSP